MKIQVPFSCELSSILSLNISPLSFSIVLEYASTTILLASLSLDTEYCGALSFTKQEYHIKNINLGLEERARTDIRLEQYIEGIYLMKEDDVIFSAALDENGKVITNNEANSHLDKLILWSIVFLSYSFYSIFSSICSFHIFCT